MYIIALLSMTTVASATRMNVLVPPKGWNSWDCFQGNLNETGATAVAETMVKYLLPAGYDILTIDEFWYNNNCAAGSTCVDEFGRAQPDEDRWPSSVDPNSGESVGFKPFTDKMHAMGLKVGIHTLRGSVSSEAIAMKSPILGGNGATVDQIVTTKCQWNSNWWAINMSHPASQPWLDSVYGQYADWGVDLIKNDCIFAFNMVEDNIKGVSKAIAKTGYPTVYSLSPGGGQDSSAGMKLELKQAQSIASDVNIYRVTNDWHGGNMEYHFGIAETMQKMIAVPGLNGLSFPDLDMLNPYKNASSDPEFQMQMTLWAIARSPLIYGADLRSEKLTADDFTLLTNPEMLAVSENSTKNRPVPLPPSRASDYVVWTADSTEAKETSYVAFIKRSQNATVAHVSFGELGMPGHVTWCDVRDLWAHAALPKANNGVSHSFSGGPGYEGALYSLSDCQ